MTFKFHFPNKAKGTSSIAKEESEGPKKGNLGKSNKQSKIIKNKRLRGSSGTARQASGLAGSLSGRKKTEGPEGPELQGYARFSDRTTISKKPSGLLTRSRSINIRSSLGSSTDFGPFDEIAKFGGDFDIGIEDIREAKKILGSHDRIPVTVRFYVDINKIKLHNITSALVTLENAKASVEIPSLPFMRRVSISNIRQEFQASQRRHRRSIIDTEVVDFADLYEGDEEVSYDFTLSDDNFRNLTSNFTPEGININRTRIKRDRVSSVEKHIDTYDFQVINWSKGNSEDPGFSLNKSPGIYDTKAKPYSSVSSRNIDIAKTREQDRPGTGTSVHSGKMGNAAASLFRGINQQDIRQRITYVSNFVPVIVNLYLKNPKVNKDLNIKIQLKSKTFLANQVIASSSKKVNFSKRIKACQLAIEAPTMTARYSRTAEGGDWYNITLRQIDYAATHISIYGKSFDSAGHSMRKGWTKLRTLACSARRDFITTQINTNIDKLGSYSKIALRAIATNKLGIGSKYSAAGITNPNPSFLKSSLHTTEMMPCVFTINSRQGVDITVRNTINCSLVNIMREDMTSGETKILHARVIKQTTPVIAYRDTKTKTGKLYRYYVKYINRSEGQSFMISHKDSVIKKSSMDADIKGIDLKIDSHSTHMGNNPALDDDSVKIIAKLSYSSDGLTEISRILDDLGIKNSKSSEISKISENFNKLFGIRVSRIHVQTGERVSYGYHRLGKDISSILISDDQNTRESLLDANFGNLIPGDTYVYNFRLHKTTIPELLGGDDTSETSLQNPKLSLSLLKGSRRRFLKNNSTSRGILPSESFVQNNNNYGSLKMAFARGFTGLELNYEVNIPETNSGFDRISLERLSREQLTISWRFSGDLRSVDHFVVFEVTNETKAPIGARISASRGKNLFKYHVIENLDQYNRTYLIEAYDDDGQVIDSIETEPTTPPPPIDSKVIQRTSW